MSGRTSGGNNGKITRREFIGGAAALCAGAVFTGLGGRAIAAMAPAPADAAASVPALELRATGSFKILQVTDLHVHYVAKGYLADPVIIDGLRKMVEIFQPDFIANTGDFWSNMADSGADTCKWLCREFANLKTPWAFAWGNHDESTDYDRTHKVMETAPYSLYRGAAADGNYRVEVHAAGNDAPLWNMIFLNNSRGGFRKEQIDWFNAEAARIRKQTPSPPPAFLFFHIPVPQYDDIAAAGKAIGVKLESVCHENGSRDAFKAFRDAGFVKAMFCGHDHVNDYYGYISGIRLQYGRSLGGYGKEKVRKGGTLITVDTASGAFDTKSVFPDGSTVTFDTFITEQENGRIY